MTRRGNGPVMRRAPVLVECMLCAEADLQGHVVVVQPPPTDHKKSIVLGRVCSLHTLWELIASGRFWVEITPLHDDGKPLHD